MGSVEPIWRATRRRSRADEDACSAKVRAEGRCRCCGRVPQGSFLDALNRAHLLRGSYREWDPRGVVPLCGSGTTGCHALVDSGDPAARRRLRASLTAEEEEYVVSLRGRAWLDERYPREEEA